MEESGKNRITPGGNPEMGNPSTSKEVAELYSDSGESSLSLVLTSREPTVDHLAVGATPKASSESDMEVVQSGKEGPGSISSRLGDLQIGLTTDDDFSSKGSLGGSVDSDAEGALLDSETDTARRDDLKNRKKEVTAEQKAKKAYKNAQAYLKKMSGKKDEELTPREKDLIRLNKKKVSRFESEHQTPKLETIEEEAGGSKPAKKLQRSDATTESPKLNKPRMPASAKKTAKRVRSGDGEEVEAKRLKPSVSFDSPEEFQIAVIDRSDLDGRMTSERWMEVESRILLAIAELDSGSCDEIAFNGAGWQKGVKVVGCSNRKSCDFLTQVIRNCGELWQGAQLEVIQMSQLPLRKKISIWIPPPVPDSDETVLKILSNQNRNLKVQRWRIISTAKDQGNKGKSFVFTIDEESLEALKLSKGSIKFGLGNLKAKLPNDKKGGETEGTASGAD